jgi:ribose transport system permease protein
MKRVAGIAVLLLTVMTISALIEPVFVNPYNMGNIMRWSGLFGILSLGEAFVIMTGGIDLSGGSIVGLIGALSAHFLKVMGLPIPLALFICFAFSVMMGWIHGLLVTEFEGLKFLVKGKIPAAFWPAGNAPGFIADWSLPMPFVILVVVGIILAIFLNRSIYGRYILALGRNERAARFSGINTHRMTIVAYIISSTCAGLAGILLSLDLNTVQPSTAGNMYELYAIAGCVVGGCSLRGGEGNILGVIIGTAIVRVLYNSINILGIATQLEFAVVGLVILFGVGSDEVIKRFAAGRKLAEMREVKTGPAQPEATGTG